MAIQLTDLLGTDNIAASRITINQNFQILEDSVNEITGYLDPSDKSISNIENLEVKKGDVNITETLITTNGTINAGGNVVSAGHIEGNSLTSVQNITMNSGELKILSPNGYLKNTGSMSLDGEFVYSDFATTAIDASNELTFLNAEGDNNLIYTGSVAIAGKISAARRNSIIINWQNFVSSVDTQFYLHRLTIKKDTENAKVGQRITIMSKINEDLSLPQYGGEGSGYWILKDCLEYTTGNAITVGIKFTKSYQSVDLIFNGTNWVILSVYGAQVI